MITPWEIYWVLQLDSISTALLTLALVFGLAIVLLGLLWGLASSESEKDAARVCKKLLLGLAVPLFVVGFVGCALLPSTKTAAAMIIVPQIVNSPTIQHEAGDLYKLAKEALRDAIAPKPGK